MQHNHNSDRWSNNPFARKAPLQSRRPQSVCVFDLSACDVRDLSDNTQVRTKCTETPTDRTSLSTRVQTGRRNPSPPRHIRSPALAAESERRVCV